MIFLFGSPFKKRFVSSYSESAATNEPEIISTTEYGRNKVRDKAAGALHQVLLLCTLDMHLYNDSSFLFVFQIRFPSKRNGREKMRPLLRLAFASRKMTKNAFFF